MAVDDNLSRESQEIFLLKRDRTLLKIPQNTRYIQLLVYLGCFPQCQERHQHVEALSSRGPGFQDKQFNIGESASCSLHTLSMR
jgi:hypothetical protein